MPETAIDTARRRVLQDRWLALPVVRERIQRDGENARVHGGASPTYREVRDLIQPEWEEWFQEFLKIYDSFAL